MNRRLRLALVVIGLALAVYGTASLSGGWLGTPPWWDHAKCAARDGERSPSARQGVDQGIVDGREPTLDLDESPEVLGALLPPSQGAWCGTPDLGEGLSNEGAPETIRILVDPPRLETSQPPAPARSDMVEPVVRAPSPGREWIGGAIVLIGLGLAAVGGWSRRDRKAPRHGRTRRPRGRPQDRPADGGRV